MVYVIRDEEEGNYDDEYELIELQLIDCVELNGGNYKSDNGSVWSLLAEHLIGIEAMSIVNRFTENRDGRTAWQALVQHM